MDVLRSIFQYVQTVLQPFLVRDRDKTDTFTAVLNVEFEFFTLLT